MSIKLGYGNEKWLIDQVGIAPIVSWDTGDDGRPRWSVLWEGWQMTSPDGKHKVSTGPGSMVSGTPSNDETEAEFDHFLRNGGVKMGNYTLTELAEIAASAA